MLIEIGLLVLTILLWLYWYIAKNFGKWEKAGIPCISGRFPYGSNSEILTQSKHFNEFQEENYRKFKDKDVFGTYLFGKPILNINNVDMAKDILVKHFNSFVDRNDSNLSRIFDGGDMDQLWHNQLTNLSQDEWKDVRSAFSPIFTSGKMKGMLKFMEEVGSRLATELGDKHKKGTDFELKDVFGKFSLDTLATCAFGIDPGSFKDKDTVFVKNAARVFTSTLTDNMNFFFRLLPLVQSVQKKLNINVITPKETKFFADVIKSSIAHRRKTGHRENDLIDMMIDCIKLESSNDMSAEDTGKHTDETELDQYEKDMQFNHSGKKQFDEDTIVATSLVLLVAGYDTTGMTLSFLAYELGKNPDYQEKLQEEVDNAFESSGGKFPDYSTIQRMQYLDACIHETLRLHTPVGNLFRCCTNAIKLDGVDLLIKKNDLVSISAIGIHHDERYYPKPNQFNPDNFSKEARASRSPYTFLGFGQGPRACIGMRFAVLEAKVAMIKVMREFSFLPSSKNPEQLILDPASQLGYIKGGVWSNIQRREI